MGNSPTVKETEQRSLLVRGLWFLVIGWWATGIWLSVAWFLNVTIIGIPLGIKMINLVPLVVSLRRRRRIEIISEDEIESQGPEQFGVLTRAVWFLFVGWWASGVWTGAAYVFTISIVGLPVAVWMYDKLPFIVSLYRY